MEGAQLNHQNWPEDSTLGRLSVRTREALLALGTMVPYGPRQMVFRQGEPSHHVLVMLSGLMKVLVDTEFGSPVLLALRGRGDLLGEMSMLEGIPRTATVVACRPAEVKLIRNSELREFLDRNPDAWSAVASSLSSRLHTADSRRVEIVACPAPVRVARLLATIVQRYGKPTADGWDLDVSLTQGEIASLAGVALTTFEKLLQAMQRRGLVRRCYRRIVVEDLTALWRFGETGDGEDGPGG